MNVNRLYLAYIYVYNKKECVGDYVYRHSNFVKKIVVYHNYINSYIDIKSGEKYLKDVNDCKKYGDMFIGFSVGLEPLNELEEINFERKNMSKRRILKKISSASLLSKKEEDK